MTKGKLGRLTDWKTAGEKHGLTSLLEGLVIEKEEERRLLIGMGLPFFERLDGLRVSEVTLENARLYEFLSEYKQFFSRVRPIAGKPLRKIPCDPPLRNFLDLYKFVHENTEGNENYYLVDVQEWKPQQRGIAAVLQDGNVLLEVSRDGLDSLSRDSGKVHYRLSGRRNALKPDGVQDNKIMTDALYASAFLSLILTDRDGKPRFVDGYYEAMQLKGKPKTVKEAAGLIRFQSFIPGRGYSVSVGEVEAAKMLRELWKEYHKA